jgi:hypothetical protein
VFDIIDAKPIGLHPTNTPHQLGPSHRAKHYPSSQCYGPASSDRGSQPFSHYNLTLNYKNVFNITLVYYGYILSLI